MAQVERYFIHDFWSLGGLPLGVALALVTSVPQRWPSPIQAIDRLIEIAERGLRSQFARVGGRGNPQRTGGLILATVVVGFVASLAWLLTDVLGQIGGPASLIGRGLMIASGLSIHSLGQQARRASESSNWLLARRELGLIEGRDCAGLDATGINRACVEAIGERMNRSAIAPLFWLAWLGPAGLWGYRAIDLLEQKLGRGKALDHGFGWATAGLGAMANYFPSRLTWLLIALSSALLREDGLGALKIGWRDGRKGRDSDQSWGEAAMAGALGVRLGGPASYAGVPRIKPIVGEPIVPIDRRTVRQAGRILLVGSLHGATLALLVRVVFFTD